MTFYKDYKQSISNGWRRKTLRTTDRGWLRSHLEQRTANTRHFHLSSLTLIIMNVCLTKLYTKTFPSQCEEIQRFRNAIQFRINEKDAKRVKPE